MPERRKDKREDAGDRRTFPRPPLWLNLLLIVLAAVLALTARAQRRTLDQRFVEIMKRDETSPAEMQKVRNELASMDLTREELQKALESRASYLDTLKSDQFYISIDTTKKRFNFYFGNQLLRDAPVTIGAPASVSDGTRSWTFVPLKGETKVMGKAENSSWTPAPWVYLVNQQPVPANPAPVAAGLGKLVIELPNGYLIHSAPAADSPLHGAKPGSFLVAEDELRAIWPRVKSGMRVYVF